MIAGGLLLPLLAVLQGAPPPAGAPAPAAAELERLEAAVAAEPESLERANDYRRAILRAGEYDRAIAFFEGLAAAHPRTHSAWLNFGYAYVDKIPTAGSVTRVLLANSALQCFSQAIELERSWLALYTRGNSYLYWPRVFGRGPLAVADLEEAVEMSRGLAPRPVHARAYLALGDAYWRTDEREKALATWREGRERFPAESGFGERLALEPEALEAYIYERLDPHLRVDTDLAPLWEDS
jgi:tetratricopeptide (TPR) repeat protein